jgi:hypothetical protein
MSCPKPPAKAKLVIGLFLKDMGLVDSVAHKLANRFGPIDIVSSWFAFDYTSYYEREMGAPLFRRMFAFKELTEQTDLAGIKLETNALEIEYSQENKRRINLDPGYMLRERFVLATGKNFSHRIYIGSGIYADLTLVYAKRAFQMLPWTYPDYAQENMLEFLKTVRKKYVADIT